MSQAASSRVDLAKSASTFAHTPALRAPRTAASPCPLGTSATTPAECCREVDALLSSPRLAISNGVRMMARRGPTAEIAISRARAVGWLALVGVVLAACTAVAALAGQRLAWVPGSSAMRLTNAASLALFKPMLAAHGRKQVAPAALREEFSTVLFARGADLKPSADDVRMLVN